MNYWNKMPLKDIEDIKRKYNEELDLINSSKRKIVKAEKLLNIKPVEYRIYYQLIIILFLLIIIFYVNNTIFFVTKEKEVVYIPQEKIIEKQPIIYKITNKIIEKTEVEYKINATESMFCLSQPNDKKMICYKNEK